MRFVEYSVCRISRTSSNVASDPFLTIFSLALSELVPTIRASLIILFLSVYPHSSTRFIILVIHSFNSAFPCFTCVQRCMIEIILFALGLNSASRSSKYVSGRNPLEIGSPSAATLLVKSSLFSRVHFLTMGYESLPIQSCT